MTAPNGPDRPLRVVQVSDTHLSETHAYFIDNYDVFVDEMQALQPDLIVHTGDISFNGPLRPADLAFAKAQLDRLPAPVLTLAGNHDIGEAPPFSRLDQPIDTARMEAWTTTVGPMWWSHDLGNWRLIGLDSALMASGLAEEAAQLAFLRDQLASRGARQAMVFMHMPPFETDAKDERIRRGGRCSKPAAMRASRSSPAGICTSIAGSAIRAWASSGLRRRRWSISSASGANGGAGRDRAICSGPWMAARFATISSSPG